VEQDLLRLRRERGTVAVAARAGEGGDVHEVRDHLDGLRDLELVGGHLLQELGDGGDAVRPLDPEARDLEERAVLADQRDVGAVQGRDEPGRTRPQHLLGEEAGDGVGDRVVDVEQVEAVFASDLRHLRGQGQVVRRVLEEAVRREVDLVVADVLLELVQPEGQSVGHEVHGVAAPRQLLAELGRHRARSSHRRITRDPDVHRWIT
jgi:hypothetical protein